MGYSADNSRVRVDFFRETGKWYTTEAVQWYGGYVQGATSIHDEFRESLKRHLQGRLSGMWAVCLDPYHEHAFPLMVRTE